MSLDTSSSAIHLNLPPTSSSQLSVPKNPGFHFHTCTSQSLMFQTSTYTDQCSPFRPRFYPDTPLSPSTRE